MYATLENESDIKAKEIAKLKQENEELKKQLDDVAMFKQCVAMMQLHNSGLSANEPQVGSPVLC